MRVPSVLARVLEPVNPHRAGRHATGPRGVATTLYADLEACTVTPISRERPHPRTPTRKAMSRMSDRPLAPHGRDVARPSCTMHCDPLRGSLLTSERTLNARDFYPLRVPVARP